MHAEFHPEERKPYGPYSRKVFNFKQCLNSRFNQINLIGMLKRYLTLITVYIALNNQQGKGGSLRAVYREKMPIYQCS